MRNIDDEAENVAQVAEIVDRMRKASEGHLTEHEIVLASMEEPLPDSAQKHREACPGCQATVEELIRDGAPWAGTLGERRLKALADSIQNLSAAAGHQPTRVNEERLSALGEEASAPGDHQWSPYQITKDGSVRFRYDGPKAGVYEIELNARDEAFYDRRFSCQVGNVTVIGCWDRRGAQDGGWSTVRASIEATLVGEPDFSMLKVVIHEEDDE